MSEYRNDTQWREKLKSKPARYWIRDEIEEIIKEENIDRRHFHEASKQQFAHVIDKFYYTFFDYENCRKPDRTELGYLWLRIRDDICLERQIICGKDWCSHISNIKTFTPPENLSDLHWLILSQGWVYEGNIDEIIAVLSETDGFLDDFYVVSKKYDRMIVYCEDGDCMSLMIKS